jgi:hypothetical protein
MSHDPINLQFANQTVSITIPATSGECLPKHLRRHFAGCLVEQDVARTAVFRLEMPQNKQWQLWQDDILCREAESVTFLFEPLMQAVLEQLITSAHNHLVLHAGCVTLAEQGILLCGNSGSGKSTLTAHLVQKGFDYLSDEAVAVDLSLASLQGFARSLVLKAGSEFIWRNRRADNDALPLPHGITWVTPKYLGGKICTLATPTLLLFPRYEPEQDLTIMPLSPGETAFALFKNLVNARNLPEQGFRLTAELARRTPGYRVTYGDGTAVADWLRARLSEL